MKGQVVVGALLLVLVFIAISGSLYFFVRDTGKDVGEKGSEVVEESAKKSEAAIAIYEVYKSNSDWNVTLKNIGKTELNVSSLSFYLNDSLVNPDSTDCNKEFEPEVSCNFTFSEDLEYGDFEVTGPYGTWDQVNLTEM